MTANIGGTTPLRQCEPYAEPVQLDAVLDEIATLIRRFIVLDAEQADACALWVIHTHCHDLAQRSPLLIINAPTRSCGKTQLLTLIGELVNRPLKASSATTAAIFRAVDKWAPTLLIDEADTFFKQNSELAGIVNAGYEKGGFVLRTVGDEHIPKQFPVYSPKAVAGIALDRHLAEATLSRGIVINLRRKLQHEVVERLRRLDANAATLLTQKIVRACMDQSEGFSATEPELPDELADRAQDNWEPLLAIADCAGGDWPRRARAAACKLSADAADLENTGEELLDDIREIFAAKRVDRLSSASLIESLIADTSLAWATYNRGRPISPRQLAQKLSQYRIGPQTIRIGNSSPKGYYRADFEEAFTRYLGAPKARPKDAESPHTDLSYVEVPQHVPPLIQDEHPDSAY